LHFTNAKKGAGSVVKVIEHLPTKHEALNSIPNTANKKKKKRKKRAKEK
jgi:hypothetical protein